jgi:hypothetical protein
MAMSAADLGGSLWFQSILNSLHALWAGGVTLPIAMRTRAVPTHLPTVLTEATDGVLLATFDSIPLYTYGSADKDDMDHLYPSGTWTDRVIEQET